MQAYVAFNPYENGGGHTIHEGNVINYNPDQGANAKQNNGQQNEFGQGYNEREQ